MASSFQEEFMGELSKRSLGAYSIFEPDTYLRGSAQREPADLAWFSRDSVILLNMQAGRASQESQDRHNVRQLDGWMRAWASGRPLLGRNESREFAIDLDQVSSILAVSVTSDPEADVSVLGRESRVIPERIDLRLAATVSIPESVLMELAHRGGAAIDLVDLVLRVSSDGGTVTAGAAVQYLRDQRKWAIERALADIRMNPDRDEELDNWIFESFSVALRASSLTAKGAAIAVNFDAFNDLDWESSALLALSSADVFRMVRDVQFGEVGPTVAAVQLELVPYVFFLAAYDINKQAEFGEKLAEAEQKLRDSNPGVPVIGVHWQIVGRPIVEFASAMLTFGEGNCVSVTTKALHALRVLVRSGTVAGAL